MPPDGLLVRDLGDRMSFTESCEDYSAPRTIDHPNSERNLKVPSNYIGDNGGEMMK